MDAQGGHTHTGTKTSQQYSNRTEETNSSDGQTNHANTHLQPHSKMCRHKYMEGRPGGKGNQMAMDPPSVTEEETHTATNGKHEEEHQA